MIIIEGEEFNKFNGKVRLKFVPFDELIERRSRIESALTSAFLSKKNSIICFKLIRNYNGTLISLTPNQIRRFIKGIEVDKKVYYAYMHLSSQIHSKKRRIPRTVTERKILRLLGFNYKRVNFIDILKEFDKWSARNKVVKFFNIHKLPLPSKEKLNRINRLIRRWRAQSEKLHYIPNKQERRKMKKIEKRNKGI